MQVKYVYAYRNDCDRRNCLGPKRTFLDLSFFNYGYNNYTFEAYEPARLRLDCHNTLKLDFVVSWLVYL